MEKIIFNISPELKKDFQIKLIQENKNMTEVLVGLVKQYLGKE